MNIMIAFLLVAVLATLAHSQREYFQPEINGICRTTSPCLNGAECRNINSTSFVCKCERGWTGINCESQIDFCNPNPCKNGASCNKIGYLDYSCSCSTTCGSSYAGKNCEISNFCSSAPCLNGGKCINTNSTFICMCPRGFSGINCEIVIDYCSPNPCQNGGSCQKWGFFDYKCSCSANYTGSNCQQINYCTTNPCLNGGQCLNYRSSYGCQCSQWFTGNNCQTQINYCSKSNPCMNGGTCSSCYNNPSCQQGSVYNCQCTTGFAGTNCNGYTTSTACSSACKGRTCQVSNGIYYCRF